MGGPGVFGTLRGLIQLSTVDRDDREHGSGDGCVRATGRYLYAGMVGWRESLDGTTDR